MNLKRSAGVLLNISCLPSRFAIGGLGDECVNFAKKIRAGGFSKWQMLPQTPVGAGNSPYSSDSLFAGNELYICPERLWRAGFVSRAVVEEAFCPTAVYKVDYDYAKYAKAEVLREAYANFDDMATLKAFEKKNAWVKDYALYKAIKATYPKSWVKWDDGLKFKDKKTLAKFKKANIDTYYFEVFKQYLFLLQWEQMRADVAAEGVELVGDMPIYPSFDSADVWANPQLFMLNDKLGMKKVAGVPPDYFSETGQLWNNPVYDWQAHIDSKFKWWKTRFLRMKQLFAVVRIDHFRGLDRFWAVPAKAKTAVKGKWMKAPGAELFATVLGKKGKIAGLNIIAEDLGNIDAGVEKLLKVTGFPCMRVLQFGFSGADNIHLPHNYSRNTVAYTGTHDNNTTLGWYYRSSAEGKAYIKNYLDVQAFDDIGGENCALTKAAARMVIKSSAILAVLPWQDILGYGSDCRMNTPGVAEGNWEYRATKESLIIADMDYFAWINGLFGRG